MRTPFVVLRRRGSAWDETRPMEKQAEWRAHAVFMESLHADGFVALVGPLEGTRDALLVVRGGSCMAISDRLSADPWTRNGLVVLKECRPWTIRLGTLG